MTQRPSTEAELEVLAGRVEGWLEVQRTENPVVAAVERDEESGERRWFVRVRGEAKDVFTIWFHLDQRTLENAGQLYEYLLRQNAKLYGAAFGIGVEDAVFMTGQIGNDAIDDDELDRVLGSLYVWVERFFPTAIRIGFASRFTP